MKQARGKLQGVVDKLMASMPSSAAQEKLAYTTVNGVPGFAFKYTYTEGGKELTAVTYFLFKGKYEYELTAQATSADWGSIKGDLQNAMESFTVK